MSARNKFSGGTILEKFGVVRCKSVITNMPWMVPVPSIDDHALPLSAINSTLTMTLYRQLMRIKRPDKVITSVSGPINCCAGRRATRWVKPCRHVCCFVAIDKVWCVTQTQIPQVLPSLRNIWHPRCQCYWMKLQPSFAWNIIATGPCRLYFVSYRRRTESKWHW